MNIISHTKKQDYLTMIEYAIKAPSGHNSQPWKFKITDNTIRIIPDFKSSLPIVDPENRELYISIGCALENLLIAAEHLGYTEQILITDEISVILDKTEPLDNPLFKQITARQTNKQIYNGRIIAEDIIETLQQMHTENNIKVHYIKNGSPLFLDLINYIIEGNILQMNDKDFKKELVSFMRFNKKDIRENPTGISYKVFQAPPLPTILGKYIISHYLKPERQNRSDVKKINSSSHLVLITTTGTSKTNWINTGRVLERLLLKTTTYNIANAYMNQPCESKILAEKINNRYFEGEETPMILLRIGYAKAAPYTTRLNLKDVLIE